jgi:glycosyltransferase involved in cell wall biosynthesis
MPDPYKAFLLVNSTEDFKPGKCPELDYATDIVLGERPAIPQNTRVIKPEDFDEEHLAVREALTSFNFFQKAEKLVLLTVILDARGDVSLIKKSIESIAGQLKKHTDLIIILPEKDDSAQKNAEIILAEIQQDRIRYVRVPNEEEKVAARNLAIKQAGGEFVIFIQAGEVLSANYLKYFASALDAKPHADVFYSKLVKISAGRPELITPPRYVNLNMQAHRNYFTSGAMVRKSLWEAIGGYRESIKGLEDWDFYLAALLCGAKFQFMDCPGIISFSREKQISDNPHIHQSSVYAQMVLNNLAAFSLLEINTARTKLEIGRAHV